MFTPWADLDRAFPGLDIFRRLTDALDTASWLPGDSGPRASWIDAGDHLQILLETPGFVESELKVDAVRDTITVAGERKLAVPEGYRALRRERGSLSFIRSFGLPEAVDPAGVTANLKDGVLTVRVAKVAAPSPRTIPVNVAQA